MTDDAQLTALMNRSVAELDIPLDRLQHGSVTAGRRLKVRRRAAAGLTGAATVAAVVLALSPGPGAGADGGPGFAGDPGSPPTTPSQSEAANTEPATSGEPSAASSTLTVHTDPGPGFWDMPAHVMLDRLEPLLPADVSVIHAQLALTDPAPGESSKARGWLRVTIARDGVTGTADLELMLWSPAQDSGVVQCPGNLEPGPAVDCRLLTDGSGRRVQVTTGALVEREATVRAARGYVYVATANSTDDKWGEGSTTSTPEPLLTLDELEEVARAGAWTEWEPAGH